MHSILRLHQDCLSMDIDGIQTFVAIAELGGFTRAGRRLHRTQPAISRRLNILEHELGAPLFERIRGNARLTEAGRTFLPHAEAALAALKDGREAVRGLQGGMHGVVSLALVGTLADTHIVDVRRRFARRAKQSRCPGIIGIADKRIGEVGSHHVPPRKQVHDEELEALRSGLLGVHMLTAAT
jgi:hypothetical protein